MTEKKDKLILGVVGSRSRNNDDDFCQVLIQVMKLKPDMIVSGGCYRGADKFAEEIAKILGIPILVYYPKERRREFYFERNKQIAKKCDVLLALVAENRIGGTENTIKHAKEFGKKIIIK